MKYSIVILFFVFALSMSNEKILTLNEPLGNIKLMKVNVDFGMGNLILEKGQQDIAITGYLKYNRRYTDAQLEYNEYGSTGILDVKTDFEFEWSNNDNGNKAEKSNDCELYLTQECPLTMMVDVGMGESHLNLEGLKISKFIMDSSLGDVSVDFGKQYNEIECEKVDIDNGLGSINIKNLANLNTDKMDFECGLGSMDLGFGGALKRDISVDISIGLGSMDIRVPRGTNVIFEYDGSFLSSVDIDNFNEISEKEYRSDDFVDGQPTISFSVSIGAGSLNLIWTE